jgi:hypothetical protein
VSLYGIGDFCKCVPKDDKMAQWECLAKIVADRNPGMERTRSEDCFGTGCGFHQGWHLFFGWKTNDFSFNQITMVISKPE